MNQLVGVEYRSVEHVTLEQSGTMLHRFLVGELPGFVVKRAGVSLMNALDNTGIAKAMVQEGFRGNLQETVSFEYNSSQILPPDLSEVDFPADGDWYLYGVTPFHQDIGAPGVKISGNHTRYGSVLYRLHAGRETYDPIAQWDELNPQMGNVLLHGVVDPNILDPKGYTAEVGPGDLFMFDTNYIHSGQSLVVPRLSEAVFYMRQE